MLLNNAGAPAVKVLYVPDDAVSTGWRANKTAYNIEPIVYLEHPTNACIITGIAAVVSSTTDALSADAPDAVITVATTQLLSADVLGTCILTATFNGAQDVFNVSMIPLVKTGFIICIVPVETIVAGFALPAVIINDGSLIVHVTDWEKKTVTAANVKQIDLSLGYTTV